MMGWYGGRMGGLGMLGMGLFWLILLGLIVWLRVDLAIGHPSVEDLQGRLTSRAGRLAVPASG